ncbi:MAG: dipeptidase PepE [Cyclobacteriaceae bacterium]
MKRLLLLSNSTIKGQPFLSWPEIYLTKFLGDGVKNVLFIPFAGVSLTYDEYFKLVSNRFLEMSLETCSAHQVDDIASAIDSCDAIAVGGGNTWRLADELQKGWLEPIREAVKEGKPYFGWSAGANVACPTIKTTNDMPIVQPQSFEALGLVDFQINPHYTEDSIPNHGGETRPERIKEYVIVNPNSKVMGLPEGSLLQVEGSKVEFLGQGTLKLFSSTGISSYASDAII